MPARVISVPAGASIFDSMFPAVMPRCCQDDTCLSGPEWAWERVAPRTRDNSYNWGFQGGLWPSPMQGFLSDSAYPCSLTLTTEPFQPWECAAAGNFCSKYIQGVCRDSIGGPIGGVNVQGFRTSDDLYIGETQTNDQGRYELRCPNTPTDQHYLVAYYTAGGLAGTTVNTLIPTNRDGTV
jgi:hypothetical protein